MKEIDPCLKVEKPDLSHRQIDPHILHGSQESFLLVLNNFDQNKEAQIVLKESRQPVQIEKIYPDQAIIQWRKISGDRISLKIQCQSKEVSILQIIWQ